jgi:hypothetical protein
MTDLAIPVGPGLTAPSGGAWRYDDVIDRYSGFDHRVAEATDSGQALAQPPSWVRNPEDRRRIVAYRIAGAAMECVVRLFYEREDPTSDYYQLREHGHAAAFVERKVNAIIGDDPSIRIPGADVDLPPEPPIRDKPEEPAEGADEIQQLAHQAALEVWRGESLRKIAEWTANAETHQAKVERQHWFNEEWADGAQWWQQVYLSETEHVTPLGDGVKVWSIDEKLRPRVDVYHPGHFHRPDDPDWDGDFPRRVHIAWPFRRPASTPGLWETWLRRITWELFPVGQPWQPVYQAEPATMRCFYSDGSWRIGVGADSRMADADVDELPHDLATWRVMPHPFEPATQVEAFRVPLPTDFIPVTHTRNTMDPKWGRSDLARSMGLLDDVIAADTAIALVTNLCGEPPIALEDGTVDNTEIEFGPANAITGKARKLGFADELRALVEAAGHLERQMIKVTSMSSELAGKENTDQSGRAIGLKMSPLRQAVLRGRGARNPSYKLDLKFVQRLALIARTPGFPAGPVLPADMKWGTFIPEDLTETVQRIIQLRDRGLLTDSDSYDLLIAAGMLIKDPVASLKLLQGLDVDTAAALAEIIGHGPAAAYLGRELDKETLGLGAPKPPPAGSNPSSGGDPEVGGGPNLPRRQRSNPQPLP